MVVLQRENHCWNLVLFCFLNLLCIMPPSVFKILMLSYSLDRNKLLYRVVRAMSNHSYSILCLPPFTFILLLNLCLWHPIVPGLFSDIFYLQDECYCLIHSCRKCVLCCITTTSILTMIFLPMHVGWRSDIPYYSLQNCTFTPFVAFFCLTVAAQESVVRADPGCWPVCGWKYSSHDTTNPLASSCSTKKPTY